MQSRGVHLGGQAFGDEDLLEHLLGSRGWRRGAMREAAGRGDLAGRALGSLGAGAAFWLIGASLSASSQCRSLQAEVLVGAWSALFARADQQNVKDDLLLRPGWSVWSALREIGRDGCSCPGGATVASGGRIGLGQGFTREAPTGYRGLGAQKGRKPIGRRRHLAVDRRTSRPSGQPSNSGEGAGQRPGRSMP